MPDGSADAIFVFAGRESRKRFGVRLFRDGAANRLLLSVGRFEWRRFPNLGLPSDGGLVDLVTATEPGLRHFFVDVRPGSAACERIPRGPLGTWSEVQALARFVQREGIRTLIVVSHRQHLIRCLLGSRLALPGSCILIPIALPNDESEGRFARRFEEALKLLAYSILLSPIWLRGLFRSGLRGHPFPDIKGGFTLSQPGLREGDFRTPDAATVLPPAGEAAGGRTRD